MRHADDMVDIAESELQKLIREYAACVCEAEETVICEDGPQPHSPRMQDGLIAQATETCMSMYYLDPFANDDVAEDGKEGEDRRKRGLSIDDQERDVIDFQTIRKVPHACSASIGVSNHNHLVASIDEFLEPVRTWTESCCLWTYTGQLVHVTLHSSYLT